MGLVESIEGTYGQIMFDYSIQKSKFNIKLNNFFSNYLQSMKRAIKYPFYIICA